MRYNKLGRTGLVISEICLGAMTFGSVGFTSFMGSLEQDETNALVKHAVDKGVNFIDTADIYANGMSEQLVGGALKKLGVGRDEIVVATKVYGRLMLATPGQAPAGTPDQMRRVNNPNLWGLSRKHIFDAIDASLKRLQLDHVDLYQIHAADPLTPMEETLDALNDVVRSGRARYLGFCNLAGWQAAKALGISAAKNLARFESAQMYYSIAGRDIEREIKPFALEEGLSLLPWSPLAGGFLSGKFTRQGTTDANARRTVFDFPPIDKERAYDIIDVMKPMADQRGISVAQIALAWVLAQKPVSSVIIGARTEAQLADNIAAADVRLSADELAALDKVSALKTEYPGWMQVRQQTDRAKIVS